MKKYDFSEYTEEELLLAERNFKEILNQKLTHMIYDETLDILYEKLEKIALEKQKRAL